MLHFATHVGDHLSRTVQSKSSYEDLMYTLDHHNLRRNQSTPSKGAGVTVGMGQHALVLIGLCTIGLTLKVEVPARTMILDITLIPNTIAQSSHPLLDYPLPSHMPGQQADQNHTYSCSGRARGAISPKQKMKTGCDRACCVIYRVSGGGGICGARPHP